MGRNYRPLTQDERAQISILKRVGRSNGAIARLLHRDRSTIGRELKRNSGLRGYRPKQAQGKATIRRKKPRRQKMTPELVAYIEARICQKHSPEQIRNTMLQDMGVKVSHERIYQHIAADKSNSGELYTHLRINHKRRYRRRNRRKGTWRTKIPNRVDIDSRPAIVEARVSQGHWEADLVKVPGGYLVTLVERMSRLLLLGEVPQKTATMVNAEMRRLLTPYADSVHSVTYDNGPEFAQHEKLNAALDCKSYFAKPYHSWERGTNENTNGLIRQYFPKNGKHEKINSDNIAFVQNALNARPRKTLGWKRPDVVFLISPFTQCTVALGT